MVRFKQLLNEIFLWYLTIIEWGWVWLKNYQAKVCRYQPKPKSEVGSNKLRLVSSLYISVI